MGLGDNALAGTFMAIAILLLIILVSYAYYEYRKRKNLGADQDDAENMLCDTNKEIMVYHKGAPITLRLFQTPSGMYCRILDECQEVLLAENAETVPVIDRVEHLCIGSQDFDRHYASILSKFGQAESLCGLSFKFIVCSISGGTGVLQSATMAEPYAEAELIGGDALLRVYSRNRRRMSLLNGRTCMLSVEWIFHSAGQQETTKKWEPFGRIYDTNGCVKYDLKLSTDPKKAHKYALFHAYDKKNPSKSEAEFLRISGGTHLTTWAASQTGMSKTALVFKVHARAIEGDKKLQIATIEPAIDSGASGATGGGGHTGGGASTGSSTAPSSLSPPQQESRRNSLTSMFTSQVGDQLYSIKYKPIVDPETKSAILGVAFLLCLRHCMKNLYRTFERLALSK